MSGRSNGGYARAKNLSAEERKRIATDAANIRWGNAENPIVSRILSGEDLVFDAAVFLKMLQAERVGLVQQLKDMRRKLRLLDRSIAALNKRMDPEPRVQVVGTLPTLFTENDCTQQ